MKVEKVVQKRNFEDQNFQELSTRKAANSDAQERNFPVSPSKLLRWLPMNQQRSLVLLGRQIYPKSSLVERADKPSGVETTSSSEVVEASSSVVGDEVCGAERGRKRKRKGKEKAI